MSFIKEFSQEIEKVILEKEKMDKFEDIAESIDKKKYSVTTRFDCMQMQYLDMLAKKSELSRSALVSELTTSALMDVMAEMGLTEKFFDDLVGQTQYDKEGANV